MGPDKYLTGEKYFTNDIRRKIDAAEAMFEALEAQEMAEFDPEAARRKGYFDRARALREAALKKARRLK